MAELLFIKTFGEFSISYKGNIVSDKDNRSKKIWTLLEYLITFSSKEIPVSQLIDLMWTEDSISNAPENALKTSLHRARAMLSKLDFDGDKLILHKRDTFKWNTSVPYELDAALFETYCKEATMPEKSADERLELYDKAFKLYTGDYLPNAADEDWAVPIITYYHTLYIKMVHEALELLMEKEMYESIINYCCAATAIDQYDEKIHYNMIYALYKAGKQQAAKEQYERVMNLFYDNFGINPSKELTDLYKEIIKEEKATESDLGIIQDDLREVEADRSAYLCDYSVFQHVYRIEARSTARSGASIFLLLMTIDTPEKTSSQSLLTNAMSKMAKVIGGCLRSGDVFSRFSVNQYIIMLPTANYENGVMIGDRIMTAFAKTKPKLNVKLSFTLKHLDPARFAYRPPRDETDPAATE